MTNNELNTRGIVESIDKFNENSEQICITLNGLEGSINEFNKSITKLDSLKQIDITKKKMDELNTYKNKEKRMLNSNIRCIEMQEPMVTAHLSNG